MVRDCGRKAGEIGEEWDMWEGERRGGRKGRLMEGEGDTKQDWEVLVRCEEGEEGPLQGGSLHHLTQRNSTRLVLSFFLSLFFLFRQGFSM